MYTGADVIIYRPNRIKKSLHLLTSLFQDSDIYIEMPLLWIVLIVFALSRMILRPQDNVSGQILPSTEAGKQAFHLLII